MPLSPPRNDSVGSLKEPEKVPAEPPRIRIKMHPQKRQITSAQPKMGKLVKMVSIRDRKQSGSTSSKAMDYSKTMPDQKSRLFSAHSKYTFNSTLTGGGMVPKTQGNQTVKHKQVQLFPPPQAKMPSEHASSLPRQ